MEHIRQWRAFHDEFHRNRIDTMSGVFRGKPLAREDMTQVAFAMGTNDFHSATIGIHVLVYRTGNLIIKTRPPTAGSKFIFRPVEWLVALTTDVRAGKFLMLILARSRSLSAFVKNDAGFFGSQGIIGHYGTILQAKQLQ